MDKTTILSRLPYTSPFLFVDEINAVNENSISGTYTFIPDHDFYKGHFKNNPITPGVILTECMAQIGLVSLGIYLLDMESENDDNFQVALTSSDVEYLKPVYPGEKVTVNATKQYFRFNKLKCQVEMKDSEGNKVCQGTIAGMIIRN